MTTYLLWVPEHGATIDDAHEVEAFDAETAAEVFFEKNHGDLFDFADEMKCVVRSADGTEEAFKVSAEPSINFVARKL